MLNNQEILKKHTALTISSKDVNTSLILFPVRLETRFMDHEVEDVSEPDKALYAFKALWDYICQYKDSHTEWKVLLARQLMESIEGLDTVYREDRTRLKNLLTRVRNTIRPEEGKEYLDRAMTHIGRLATLDIVNDNEATVFLRKLSRVGRTMSTMVANPRYDGRQRYLEGNHFSIIKKYLVGRSKLKLCLPVMERLVPKTRNGKSAIDGFAHITEKQFKKYRSAVEKIFDIPIMDIRINYQDWGEREDIAQLKKVPNWITPVVDALQNNDLTRYEELRDMFDKNRQSLEDRMRAKVGRYHHYTLFAEKMILWKLNYLYGRRDIFYGRIPDKWRAIADNTIFSFNEEREWLLRILKEFNNAHEGNSDCQISPTRLNRNNHFIRNRKLSYKIRKKCLCIRVYPDEVAVTQLMQDLNLDEARNAREFWLHFALAGEDEKRKKGAWEALCSRFTPSRAAWCARKLFPTSYPAFTKYVASILPDGLPEGKEEREARIDAILSDGKFLKLFPSIPIVEQSDRTTFPVPVSRLMPDRFVVQATMKNKKRKEATIIQYGRLIPSDIQIGLDLNNEPDVHDTPEGLKFDGNLRWMTDYDAAEKMGMAISIPLDAFSFEPSTSAAKNTAKTTHKPAMTDRFFEFSSIYVMGVKELSPDNKEDSKLCSELLKEVFNAHYFSEDGLDLLKLGTPTNILSDEDLEESFDTSHDARTNAYYEQSIKPLTEPRPKLPGDADASILSALFCQKDDDPENPFLNAGNRDNREVLLARAVNRAFLEELSSRYPLLNAILNNDRIRQYFTQDVSPRGVFPPFRIGSQPYGIMPVCDFSNLKYDLHDPLYRIKTGLLLLTKHWNQIAEDQVLSEQNMSAAGSKTNERYLRMLGAMPYSTTFYSRRTARSSYMLNPLFFRGMRKNEKPMDEFSKASGLSSDLFSDFGDIPLLDADQLTERPSFSWDSLRPRIEERLKADESLPAVGEKELTALISGTFDLFNHRLDAWLTGLLHRRIASRIREGKHKIAIGAYGWVFNLKQNAHEPISDEYVLAPSVNHAVTAAVLRSSFVKSRENTSKADYNLSVNLSSSRVRQAIRIINGLQNGLPLGAILGSDLERLLHEDYKKKEVGGKEMDFFIMYLRRCYPLVMDAALTAGENDSEARDLSLDVLNGAALLRDLKENLTEAQKKKTLEQNYQPGSKLLKDWLRKLFATNTDTDANKLSKSTAHQKRLIHLIQQMDDAYDALADTITSETVYKLTEGNRAAVEALMQCVQNERNIPLPDVAEIPLSSAHIEQRVFVALDSSATPFSESSPISQMEPALDKWLGEILGYDAISLAFGYDGADETCTLADLGLSPGEFVYLSRDKESFEQFLRFLYWFRLPAKNRAKELPVLLPDKTGDIPYQETRLAVDSLREMLAGSRELRQEDLRTETLEDEPSNDRPEELKERYDKLYQTVEKLKADLDEAVDEGNRHFAEHPADPIPEDLLVKAAALKLRCFRIGMTDALAGQELPVPLSPDARFSHPADFAEAFDRQKRSFLQLAQLAGRVGEKCSKAEQERKSKNGTVEEAARKLLTGSFLAIPKFALSDTKTVDLLLKQQAGTSFKNAGKDVVESCMTELADTRAQLARLHQVRLFGKWNCVDAALDIRPMQLTGKDRITPWLGAKVNYESEVMDASVFTVMNAGQLICKEGKGYRDIAGLVVDFWVEKIPYRQQTAALAFSYDQPDAEPPQAILVGVSTLQGKHHWSEKRMLKTIRSAMHQVKTRAVEPEHLYQDKWTSCLFPLIHY